MRPPRLTLRWLLWVAPLVLLSPVLRPGYALFWGTPSLQFVPWHWQAWDMLRHGHLPLWNPLLGAGAPLLANHQSALLYPPNWLLYPFAALGGLPAMAWAHGLLAALHLILAAWGMARLADLFGLPEPAPTVAGLAYGLSGYLVARLGFLSINAAAAWTPWLLWTTYRLLARPSRRWAATLAAIWGLQLLSGHAQTAWYTALLAGLWGLFWLQKRMWRRQLLAWGAAMALGTGMAAAQLLPTAVYLWQSQRAAGAPAWGLDFSFWPWHFLTLLAPNLFGNPAHGDHWGYSVFWEDAAYIGVLPLLLAGLSLRRGRPRRVVIWGSVVVVMGFVLALGIYSPLFMFLYHHVPTFAMFKAPARWLLWPEVALPLMAASGVAGWRRPTGRALYWTRLGTAGAFAMAVGAGLAWYLLGNVRPTFVAATALAGVWALGSGVLALTAPPQDAVGVPSWWSWAVAGWVALDLLVAGWGLNPAAPAGTVYAQTAPPAVHQAAILAQGNRLYIPPNDAERLEFRRFFRLHDFSPPPEGWRSLRASLLPNLNLLDGLPSVNNFDPLLSGRYAWYTAAAAAQPPEARRRLWARLGVGAVARVADRPPYAEHWQPLHADPRARWVPRAVEVRTPDEAWGEVARRAREGGAAWRCTVVLEGAPSPAPPACSTDAHLTLHARTPMREVWQVDAPQDGGFVVFSKMWYWGWQATVDGHGTPLYHADYLFLAVSVPAGQHTVALQYRPWDCYAGAVLSLLALAGWAALKFSPLRRV